MIDGKIFHIGTTSAYAENTVDELVTAFQGGNYLRVRGEYVPPSCFPPSPSELPPRTRRILILGVLDQGDRGTTSAYAENTACDGGVFQPEWNYLRVRGEYMTSKFPPKRGAELPPRTRRIPVQNPVNGVGQGTTSAYAENTLNSPRHQVLTGNYLRVRGEYPVRCLSGCVAWELPPRTRRIHA